MGPTKSESTKRETRLNEIITESIKRAENCRKSDRVNKHLENARLASQLLKRIEN